MISIGLLDYDVLSQRYYKAPNYDLGVIYAYYKNDRDVNIRLMSSYNKSNIEQYDKIYVFKRSKLLPHPSTLIEDYYKYPIEEYGEGFINKPLRPLLMETRFTRPDFSCYNNMILYSKDHIYSKLSWKIDKRAKGGKFQPIRLYEEFDGEMLRRDIPTQKNICIYDNPADVLNNKEMWDLYNDLLDSGHKILFAQPLDISLLNDTIILERVVCNKRYASIMKDLMASDLYVNVEWLVSQFIREEFKSQVHIKVNIPPGLDAAKVLRTLLLMGYWNAKTNRRVRLIPTWGREYYKTNELVLCAFNYLLKKPHLMSYYEYVFNIAYLAQGVPKTIIHTREEQYEYICSHYAPPRLLIKLEEWIDKNPDCKEYIFIGGSSHYEEQRRKYFNIRGS